MYNFSIKQVHQNDKEQKKQHLCMSDLEFRPIHNFFRVTIPSIKYMKDSNSDMISLQSIYKFPIKQIHQYDKDQSRQHLYMSDLEFRPILKFFRVIISSIKYMKKSNSDIISLHVYNNSPYKIRPPLGLLGYCETNATISPTKEIA